MNASDLVNDIASIDNLMLAWCKLEGEMLQLDDWCDIMEFYAYKFQLKEKLIILHERLAEGSFRMQKLRPLPFPKGPSGDQRRVRQFFHVAIEDQLVWIAYCNVIAQYAELKMPGWSYGNRTNVRVWYQWIDGKRHIQVGNYRNTRDRIYKRWGESWPLYRRRLSLTIKLMSCKDDADAKKVRSDLNDDEKQLLENNEKYEEQRLEYLDEGYFDSFEGDRLYWCGIDIEKFYPHINRQLIKDNLKAIIYENRQSDEFWHLTNTLLDFKVDVDGFTPKDLQDMKLDGLGLYPIGVPTGLLMGGFLANLAMIGIDEQVKTWLKDNHKVAHFRYVDDHVVLAHDLDTLVEWVKRYKTLLGVNGFSINEDKIEPSDIADLIKGDKTDVEAIKGLDPSYPSPLMTLTLQKVSQMANFNIEQLSKTEYDILFADLQELLIMDIPDQEIKKETRISFAVTMLSRILVHGDVDYEELGRLKRELRELLKFYDKDDEKTWREWKNWFYRDDMYPSELPNLREITTSGTLAIKDKVSKINVIYKDADKNRKRKYEFIFNLIVRALEDVPERTRVWMRMVQFCYKCMPERLGDVYALTGSEMMKEKLHPLDIEYLRMMLVYKITTLYLKDMTRNVSRGGRELTRILLNEILNNPERDKGHEKYYVRETFLYVKHVLELEQMVINKTGIYIMADDLYFKEKVDADFWMLLFLQFIKAEDKGVKDKAIETMISFVEFGSVYYPPLFLKCMENKAFQKDVMSDGALDDELRKYIKKHHLEVDVYRSFDEEYRGGVAELLSLSGIDQKSGDFITLSEWIFELQRAVNSDDSELRRHPEHLEFVALKVLQSLIKTMIACHYDIFNFTRNRYINLFNLCIHQNCLELLKQQDGWDEMEVVTMYNASVYPVSRYPLDESLFSQDYRDVYDMGVILLQMLALNQLPTDYLTDAEYGYKWEKVIRKLMSKGYMSFCTYMVLMSCLSRRNRESYLFRNKGNEEKRADENLDPPMIYSLEELLKYVECDIQLLREHRVYLPEKGHRILSEVSFETFRNYNNKVMDGAETSPDLEDFLKVDIIQTNMDWRQAWGRNKQKKYEMTDSEMKQCWSEIVMYFKQIMEMDAKVRPQIVILPEYAIDEGYYYQLKRLADKAGSLVIAGRNFLEMPGNRLMNKAVVFVPYRWPNGQGNTCIREFEFGKYYFAKVEEQFIKDIGYQPLPFDKMYIVDTGRYGKMGLVICADFYDIERFEVYRGRIQHLMIIAYNKDVKSFYFLAEAISRIVFCNVIICNTGFYGGSIAFSPYEKEYKRYIYKHEGGNLYTNQIVMLPVKSLYEAQRTDAETEFKSRPPGYKAVN